MTLQYLRSNLAREAVLSGQARAKNITSFLDNCFRDRELLLPKEARCVVIFLTSKVYAYRGFGGREFSIPCISLVTWGCWPTRKLSILECVGEIAEGSTLMDRYSKPSEKAFAKQSRIFERGAENRINFPFSTPATPAGPCWLVGLWSGRPSCGKEQFGNLSRKAEWVTEWLSGGNVDFVQFMRKPWDCNRLNFIWVRRNASSLVEASRRKSSK